MNARLAALLPVLGASIAMICSQDDSQFAIGGYPAEMVAAARLAERRCTKCHTLGRVLEADYAASEWTAVVQQMERKEKSGISAQDAGTIAAFLAYRSTHKPGAAEAPASRPGVDLAAASRPATFGGSLAYPVPAHTVYASASLAPSTVLPVTIDLAGVMVQVRDATATTSGGATSRAAVRVFAGGEEKSLVLARDDSGAWSTDLLTLRSWSIGPHAFRLALAVYETDASFAESRPAMKLATLVVRSAK